LVDATIAAAPSSTKNASATRDPEMKEIHKGRNWHFGMKLHIAADQRGIVHTVRSTNAGVADITQRFWYKPLVGSAVWNVSRSLGGYRINRRPTSQRPLSERWRMINRARSRTRARAEHAFRVVEQLWGFAKVRYRGLAENLARADHVCAGQLLPGPQTTTPRRGEVHVVTPIERTANVCDHLRATNSASRRCLFA
jgi:IS5 family transposase